MLSDEYIVIMPAYNEEASIHSALENLAATDRSTPRTLRRIIICVNGCTDDTEGAIAKSSKALKLPITVISSSPGYTNAINRLLGHARRYYPHHILVKTDADARLDPHALRYMFEQLDRHDELMIVGGHPMPQIPRDLPLARRLLARTFSLRSIYPLTQVSHYDTHAFHAVCKDDPQPGIGQREYRLKTFFHGRLWCARQSLLLSNLTDGVIGDDVFLTVWLYKKYGIGSIRVAYNATTYYTPNYSLRRHWKVYKRIDEDRHRVAALPEYAELQELQRTKLDWRYILAHVPLHDIVLFGVYAGIMAIENFTFAHTAYKESYWHYAKKEKS